MQNKTKLPSGIYPVAGDFALNLRNTKTKLIDLYLTKGFKFCIAPTINFASNSTSFKFADNLSNKTLEIVDDITPQISIIDAEKTEIAKYCYGQNIIKRNPDDFYSSRMPTQVGAEIYGDQNIDADVEIIDLMLESLQLLGISDLTLTIGNIKVFDNIIKQLGLVEYKKELKNIFSKKSKPDLVNFIAENNIVDSNILIDYLNCDKNSVLEIFSDINAQEVSKTLTISSLLNFKDMQIIYDFADTKTYNYHNGIIFSAYSSKYSKAIARGGRFLGINNKPGVGFSFDLEFLLQN